jgi:hypothetical protein
MTIINGIEIDIGKISLDETRLAITNNYPIADKLHVIAVISNPCQFARRYILAREFVQRMQKEENIILYIVELAYNDQKYYVTQKGNKRHLQLRGQIPLWHKENIINIGVSKLLPPSWKAFAWIDADIEFDSCSWASDALKVLNGSRDVIQLFSHAIDMDKNKGAMSIFPSFGFQYSKGSRSGGTGINMWHPGYAWACTRKAYEKMGGLYDKSILGSGDHNMALSFISNSNKGLNEASTDDYKNTLLEFEIRANGLRLGYIPGVIRHYFHGYKKDRKYSERWMILVDNQYSPSLHIKKNKDGLIVPTDKCPQGLLDDIYNYFKVRNEDEGFLDLHILE